MLNKKKINYKKNIFSYRTKLSKVVASINSLKIKLLFITKNNKLVGTLSDGDIRRFFLSNVSHDIRIENIMNRKPKFIFEKSNIEKFRFPDTVRFLPVLNKSKQIKGLLDLNNIKPIEYQNSVLIMAGGRGERLRPFTNKIPKPMLTIGKKPHLEELVNKIKESGFNDIIISLNYKSLIIKNHFKKKDYNLFFSTEKKRLGTAGPIQLASKNKKLNFPILVINSDLITNLNLSNLINYSEKIKYDLIMCVKENKTQLPFAIIDHKNDTVLKIQEKPEQKYYFSTGIYVLKKDMLNLIPKNKKFDMPDLIKKGLTKNKKIKSFFMYENWLDFGTKKNLITAKKNVS